MGSSAAVSPENAPFDGRWWSPEDPTHIVGGRLDVNRGVWGLKLFGWVGDWDEFSDSNTIPDIIHGQIGTTPISLLDLVSRGWNTDGLGPPHETQLAANTVIAEHHVSPQTRYSRAGVRMLHLNEWANRRPWSFDPGSKQSVVENAVRFVDPGELEAALPGAQARLWRGWGREGGGLSGVSMSSDEWLYFDLTDPTALDVIEHDWVRPLRNLIELAAAERSPSLELRLTREGADEYEREAKVLSGITTETSFARSAFQFLFTLDDIGFDVVLPAWWELSAKIGVVADLVAAMRQGGGYVSSQFLTAASAIEGYHRHREGKATKSLEHKQRLDRISDAVDESDRGWLKAQLAFSHEPSFDERIRAVIDRAGPLFPPVIGDLDEWIRWVKQGRNSVAHRDPKMVDLDADWRTTVRVTATIQWLLTLVLLRELGIPDDVISRGVRRNGGLESAREFLKEQKPAWFADDHP